MKAKFKFLLGTSLIFVLAGCAAKHNDDSPGDSSAPEPYYPIGSRGDSSTGDYVYDVESSDGEMTSAPGGDSGETTNTNLPRSGQITCGAVDDNKDYAFWHDMGTTRTNQKGDANEFYNYKSRYAFNTYNRLELNVVNATNAKVKIKGTQYETYVDNFHKAFLFPDQSREEYDVEISYVDSNNEVQKVDKTVKNGDTIDLEQTFTISNNLQLMFVIDATGSMGDEIRYLQSEIDNVITTVSSDNANANIELAILMYRDVGDLEEYLFRYSGFSTDIAKQENFLINQRAGGGGDFEEAVDQAMEKAVNEEWKENATKMIFFVADAPSHDKDVPTWNAAAMKAATKGIKIFSVASSGINKKTEYFFRSQSVLTGGQYIYITGHSGIGGYHLEATTKDDVVIEYLNACMIRLINGYFTGTLADPVSYVEAN